MVSLAFCDDNEFQRELLKDILQEYSETHNSLDMHEFASGIELLEYVKRNGFFDIYILDVIMPGINGMETATTLRLMQDDGRIIFTTASLEYAVASYDVRAFYYMVKPIDTDKLFKILDNAVATVAVEGESITVKTKAGDMVLNYRDIMYVEARDRSVCYHLSDGRVCDSLALRGPFREAVATMLLDDRFAMCGVSKLVNLNYVDAVDSESVLFRDGTLLLPPRSAYSNLKKAWKAFRT